MTTLYTYWYYCKVYMWITSLNMVEYAHGTKHHWWKDSMGFGA